MSSFSAHSYHFLTQSCSDVYLTGHYCHIPGPNIDDDSDDDSDYGSEFDEEDMSSDEGGIYDPETGLLADESTDGERFEEVTEAPASWVDACMLLVTS